MQDQKKHKKKQGHHRRQNSIQFLQEQEDILKKKKLKKNKKVSSNVKQIYIENDLVKKIIQKEIEDVQTKIVSIESLEDDEKDQMKIENGLYAFRQQQYKQVNINGEKLKSIEKYVDRNIGLSAIEERTEQEDSSKKTYSSVFVDGKSHHKKQSSNFFSNENSSNNLNFRKSKPEDFQQNINQNSSAFKTKKVKNFNLSYYQDQNAQLNTMFYKKTQKKDKSQRVHRKINSVTFQIGSNGDPILIQKPKIQKRSVSPNDLQLYNNHKRKIASQKQDKKSIRKKFKKKKKSIYSQTFNIIKKSKNKMPLLSKKKIKISIKQNNQKKVLKNHNKLTISDGFKVKKMKNKFKNFNHQLNITGEQLYQKSFVQNLIFKQSLSTRPNKKATFLDKFF